MAVVIRMPDFGTAVNEIRITKWLVNEGAPVKRGDLLAEVETDKATTELESIAGGVLLKQLVPEGATTESGQPVAWVGASGETPVEPAAAPAKPSARIAPVVANLAAKLGVELAAIQGTGAGGIITREDVVRKSQQQPTRTQSSVARAVERSNAEIPHLRAAVSIDMTEVGKALGGKAFYDAVFLKAIAFACAVAPMAAGGGDAIALAVETNGELQLPVFRDCGRKPLAELQTEIGVMAAGVGAGTVKLDDLRGASIALSNLGMYPVDWFEAMIFPGHVAILALGRIEDRPVVVDGRIEVRKMATAVLSADHRQINGRGAGAFLGALKQAVESGQVLQS